MGLSATTVRVPDGECAVASVTLGDEPARMLIRARIRVLEEEEEILSE